MYVGYNPTLLSKLREVTRCRLSNIGWRGIAWGFLALTGTPRYGICLVGIGCYYSAGQQKSTNLLVPELDSFRREEEKAERGSRHCHASILLVLVLRLVLYM